MKTKTSDGVAIDYEEAGQGEPALLLLPAWCMSRNGFADLGAKLAAGRRVLALDWRGHGSSEKPAKDFGADQLIEDALAVIEASGAPQVVPVTMSHAGWVGIELRRRLGERVPKLVHTDWIVFPPPEMYMDLVHGLASPDDWENARETLFHIWLEGVHNERLESFVNDEMGGYGADMWMRSGREIGGCYVRGGSPLEALGKLDPPVSTLHVYSQPGDPGYLAGQEQFAAANPWYHVYKLEAHSHFPTFEVAGEIATVIEKFVGGA